MKKAISLFLAVLMMFSFSAVIFSAGAAGTYSVTVTLSTGKVYGYDFWLVDQNGKRIGSKVTEAAVAAMNDAQLEAARSFVISGIEENTRFVFNIGLHEKYDERYTTPFANAVIPQYFSELGAYAVYVDQNIEITVPEANGQNFRIRQFNMELPYGDGYLTYPRAELGYHSRVLVNWGTNYTFRVTLTDGYRGSYNYENPESSRLVVTVLTESGETLTVGSDRLKLIDKVTIKKYSSDGKYSDQYGLYNLVVTELIYEITDVKEHMEVKVSGVMKDETVNIFTWIMRILQLLIALIFGGNG